MPAEGWGSGGANIDAATPTLLSFIETPVLDEDGEAAANGGGQVAAADAPNES